VALGSWLLALEFSTLGSTVFDGILVNCSVMVVSTLGFGVFEIFLEFSACGSAVGFAWLWCDGVGVSMVSTFWGGWDFCSNRYQFFHDECDVILRLDGQFFVDIF
jgi:hypothetical protein